MDPVFDRLLGIGFHGGGELKNGWSKRWCFDLQAMLKGIFAGVVAGALWGMVFVAPHMAPGLSAVDLVSGRFLSFGIFAALLMLFGRRPRGWPTLRQALFALWMSGLGFTAFYLLLVLAIRDLGPALPTLVIGTIPLWVMLMGKPRGLAWSALVPGLLLTATGLVLMAQAASVSRPGAELGMPWRGVLLAWASMGCWTVFALLNARWLKRHPEVNASEWTNWLGVATVLGAWGLWGLAGSDLNTLRAQDHVAFATLVCIATGLSAWCATLLWNVASQRLSASLCGQLIVSETVFALLYAFAWNGQWPTGTQLTACLLFIFGILVSIKAHR